MSYKPKGLGPPEKAPALPAMAEARKYIDKIAKGEIDPQEVQRLEQKAIGLMNDRKNAGKQRPGNLLKMTGDATVIRRKSGIVVPVSSGLGED